MNSSGFIFLFLIIFNPIFLYAQSDDIVRATVVSVEEKATVLRAATGQRAPLKSGDKLFKKDIIKCDQGCKKVTVRYCGTNKPTALKISPFEMIAINCKTINNTTQGGDSMGGKQTLIFPYEDGIVRPEKFYLKWKPGNFPSRVTLKVESNLQKEVLFKRTIDGSKGFYKSASLIRKLKKKQKAGASVFRIRITGLDKNNEDTLYQSMVFRLLSYQDQRTLNKKLKAFNKVDDPLRAIARALDLTEYAIYAEAAEELENTLKLIQNKQDTIIPADTLRTWAIILNFNAHNSKHAAELCSNFENSSSIPSICVKLGYKK